jgi:hypothetical protein
MRFSLVTRLVLLVGAAAVLASCGGGGSSSSSSSTNTPTTITVTPATLSLNHGDVVQIGSVQVLNSSNTAVSPTPTITYTSSTPSQVTVTTTGLVCAGVFDASNIVCQPVISVVPPPLPFNITVSAGGVSTTVPVFVHGRVDAITVSGPANPPVCVSQNQTEQFTAKAFSNSNDITSQVGPFTWATGNTVVATSDTNGVVTSRQPGATTVVASVASTTGTPAVVVACPPKSISLHVASATDTSFRVASGTGQTLAADVTDILGQPISSAGLTFSAYVPTAATVTSGGVVTTPGAGVTAIVAACIPPSCNPAAGPNVNFNGTGAGLAVYSNPVIATVTGTTATTVYVTGSDNPDTSANTSMIPIDITANTAGTAIALPGSPNSMVFNRAGTTAYLGTSVGMLIFDAATNAVTATASGLTGTVLAVSNDGSKVVIVDNSGSPNKVFVYDTAANIAQEFDLAGVAAADFDSDNSKGYFTSPAAPNRPAAVYEYSFATGEKALNFGADGVAFTPQGAIAYFGGSSISGLAVCNDTRADSAAGTANILAPTPGGTHMIGVGSGGWLDLRYTVTNGNGCPATAANTARTAAFPAFVGTPTKIAVASDDSNAFLTGYTAAAGATAATAIPFYHLADGTTNIIPLTGSGGILFSGGLTQDAHSLYVGVGASGGTGPQVHRIDLTAAGGPADANQINVTFNPRIVVVRPK